MCIYEIPTTYSELYLKKNEECRKLKVGLLSRNLKSSEANGSVYSNEQKMAQKTTKVSWRRKAQISWSMERCVPSKGQARQPHVG